MPVTISGYKLRENVGSAVVGRKFHKFDGNIIMEDNSISVDVKRIDKAIVAKLPSQHCLA